MFATIEKMFIEVARKIICEILTAAASAFVGHLIKEHLKYDRYEAIRISKNLKPLYFLPYIFRPLINR